MAKIFEWLKPTGNPKTNGFDVSRRDIYSTAAGILNPVRPRVVGPKSKMRINMGDTLVNTLPMINQPFNRGQFVLDFYQVPMKQIMSKFDSFYTQLEEKFESINPDERDFTPQVPHVDLLTLTSICVFDLCTYLYAISSYQSISLGHIHYLWFEGEDIFDPTFVPPSGTLEKDWLANMLILGCDVHGYPVALGTFRLLDLLGYGNYYLMFKEFILAQSYEYDSERFSDGNPADIMPTYWLEWLANNVVDGTDTSDAAAAHALIDWAVAHRENPNFGFYRHYSELVHANAELGFVKRLLYANALYLFAYQKVFNDIYRNSFYDKLDPLTFNADFFVSWSGDVGLPICELFNTMFNFSDTRITWQTYPNFTSLFQIRYRQFKKDLYTSLLPNSQFGDVSMVNVGDSLFNITNEKALSGAQITTDHGNLVLVSGSTSSVKWKSSNLTFSVLMQRRAEAIQKYKERFLRAGNRLKDQYLSEFGKVPYYLEDRYVRYLGSIDSRLSVQGVPSTSDSGEYNVAERGSYGYAGLNGKIECSVDDWSIIIPIFYYLPELDYESFGLDSSNKFSEFTDYYVPEFENLGLEPVYRTSLSQLATALRDYNLPIGGESVIGYGPSYMYFKTDVDKVHGEFGSTLMRRGVFHTWVATRGNVAMAELSDYYVRPDFGNNLFRQQFIGPQSSDQFLVVLDLDWKIIEPLSVVGLPIWN